MTKYLQLFSAQDMNMVFLSDKLWEGRTTTSAFSNFQHFSFWHSYKHHQQSHAASPSWRFYWSTGVNRVELTELSKNKLTNCEWLGKAAEEEFKSKQTGPPRWEMHTPVYCVHTSIYGFPPCTCMNIYSIAPCMFSPISGCRVGALRGKSWYLRANSSTCRI